MNALLYSGKCVGYSSEGHGIIKTSDGILFSYGLFLGEEAVVEVEYKRAGVMYGKVKELLIKSEHRISPKCPICSACGGCQFHQLDYESELEFKKNKIKDAFKTIANINANVNDVIGMDEPYYYRNKIQVPFGFDKKHNIVYGFYKTKTHLIIPFKECLIENKKANHILATIASLMKSMKIDPYDEDTRRGIIRHVLIRTSHYKSEIMVTLITAQDSFYSRNNFVKELVKSCPEITTVVQNINERDTNVILGDKEKILFGKGYISDILCGLNFNISSKSFYQTNIVQTEKLYSKVIEFADLEKNDIVLDAYSGIGTIGLTVAKKVKEVISVELVKEAYLNAKINAKANNINNFTAINDDATKYINFLAERKAKIDIVLMDPPRKGSTPEFLNAILKLRPRKIVYVSCDCASLARDVKYLKDDYKISKIQPVDMFPKTFHVETVTSLILKK